MPQMIPKHEADAEIQRLIRKHVNASLDLKLFGLHPNNVEVTFDSSLPHNAEVTKGYPCKIVFGLGALKNLKHEINQILQFIQKHEMVQPMAIVKYRHVRNHEKKWNREFIASQAQGIFRLLSPDEVVVNKHVITILKHAESGIEVSHIGDKPNEQEMRILLSKRVADYYKNEMKKENIAK